MKNLIFTLAGIACLSLSGCNDDDDDVTRMEPAASRMEMLTGRDWLLVSDAAMLDNATPDALKTSTFSKDDIFRFRPNGEAIRDEGPTKEDGKPQIVEVAKWSFMNEERALDVAFKTLPLNDEIVELTRNRLVLRRTLNGAVRLTTFEAM